MDQDVLVGGQVTVFNASDEINLTCLGRAKYEKAVFLRTPVFAVSVNWSTDDDVFDPDLVPAALAIDYLYEEKHSTEVLLQAGPGSWGMVYLTADSGHVRCHAAAYSRTEAEGLVLSARGIFTERDVPDPDDPRVPVTFWSLSPNGPSQATRKIEVPKLEDVAANYVGGVGDRIAHLAGPDFVPADGGRLILWHGPAGTGKTTALRALASEWRTWCDVHYITDPDAFFGESAAYMLQVLLSQEDDHMVKLSSPGYDEDEDDEAPDPRAALGRWRILVLEDTGEMMAADAKARTGQGLSRLLNVTDGLIGQGLRILVLVTTNETLTSLHPAVSRPGRCAAQLKFGMFREADAVDWLTDHGWHGDENDLKMSSHSLADLYAVLAGRDNANPTMAVGFRDPGKADR